MNIHYLHQSHHTHRNGYRALALGALLALALAGCSSDELLPAAPDGDGNTDPDAQPRITITADMGSGTSTRTGHDDVPAEGVKVSWAEGDKFVIFSIDADGKKVGETVFTLAEGEAGKASAAFEGTKPVDGAKYCICYPADVLFDEPQYSSEYAAYLSLRGQKQTGNNSTAHLSKFDPMQGHPVTAGDFSKISFTPDDATHKESGHRATLMRFDLTNIPLDLGTPERIVVGRLGTKSSYGFQHIVVVAGTYVSGGSEPATSTLELEKVTATGQHITAYMMMSPFTMFADSQLTITLEGSQKSYTFTSPAFGEGGKEYERGMRYVASADTWTEAVITYDGTASAGYYYTCGKGTEASPYLISTAEDLELLIGEGKAGNTTGNYYKLTRNINIPSGTAWTPIGIGSSSFKYFKGHFDGGGHTIGGEMTGTDEYFGFFGGISDATITNLHVLATVTTTGNIATGTVAGEAISSTISYCTNAGTVSGSDKAMYTGGIVGKNMQCTLINCTNRGNVTAYKTTGGITGNSSISTIIGCANTGQITSSTREGGGIAGRSSALDNADKKTISGCYNTGLISGSHMGAIIGKISDDEAPPIESCRYVLAGGQASGLIACYGTADGRLSDVAVCADLAALNTEEVLKALNAGITAWSLTAAGLPTCYPFQTGKDGNTPPVIALPASNGGIGNITDGGSALTN